MRLQEYIRKYTPIPLDLTSSLEEVSQNHVLKCVGRGKRVLDLGCSGGSFTKLIADQSNDVVGIELNENAAASARALGLDVRVFDLVDGIPFPDSSFDVIHAGRVFECVYDTKFLLQECNRVIKSSGVLLFSVPNLNSLENRLRVLAGGYVNATGAFPEDHSGDRIRLFNLAKIREICAHTGFRIDDIKPIQRPLLKSVAKLAPGLSEIFVVKAYRQDL